jgi:hypothetical protein
LVELIEHVSCEQQTSEIFIEMIVEKVYASRARLFMSSTSPLAIISAVLKRLYKRGEISVD